MVFNLTTKLNELIVFYSIIENFRVRVSFLGVFEYILDIANLYYELFLILKNSSIFLYNYCVDIICYDRPNFLERFTILYIIASKKKNSILRVRYQTNIYSKIISISPVFVGFSWSERESYDMYGIKFFKAFDLRRLLNDYDFKGFPKRKDFLYVGYFHTFFSNTKNLVIRAKGQWANAISLYLQKFHTSVISYRENSFITYVTI